MMSTSHPEPAAPVATPVVDARELTYEGFVNDYMAVGEPVIVRGLTDDWAAVREWVTPEGLPDLDFLVRKFGHSRICVSDCSQASEYGAQPAEIMSLAEYVSWWRRPDREGVLYLKDWHFAAEHPEYQAYTCPPIFMDDWLNEWHDVLRHGQPACNGDGSSPAPPAASRSSLVTSDYRFVYLGPEGSSTPLHHDVLMSHSWSVNIAGVKHWTLVPPSHTEHMYRPGTKQLARTLHGPSGEGWPGLAQARQAAREFIQQPGDAIFVPSGWHHEVLNASPALSINHNWINEHAMPHLWRLLTEETAAAEALIEDCRGLCSPREFQGLVARNVEANLGLGWAGVREMLRCACRSTEGHEGVGANAWPWMQRRSEAVQAWLSRPEWDVHVDP
ncbi:hypothetical protein ACKKBG_A02960 [Auxenochlorella protothecoides x Auxenochlorella symbiontica]|uniref:JmjC domain-containing protein 4 n=1 Tax=Auxenochlorella protothecoides TaxID=3075 RepID=A0A087SM62_AUXPR|nr:JmjC domain-containing protein 4 [Auxenochlorella protothecoides]KFM26816.1 JmjC domain-containing protein 4 [Auxenochlorella protothecoides]RMZ55753.1 hypothetical protein APUTEX25_005794 [Auxenochlorella protothecoides]|eukprot:RMZ55753.1 hypothetical protein APUTEX25_005794 [Auxenochlorella protothecoides]